MNKTKRICYYKVLVIVIIGLLVVFSSIKLFFQKSENLSYLSAISWLRAAIIEGLVDCYEKNGFYPEDLGDVEIKFPGDNAKPSMLECFKYDTDGQRFKLTLTTKVDKEKHIYEWIGEKGEIIQLR